MRIQPDDILPDGTPVQVHGKRGVVVKCDIVRAVPCGFISVHTINFTQQLVGGSNWHKWKPINQTKQVNYSFIETL